MADISGKRVVVTRPAGQNQQFGESLAAAGAVPILIPTIEIAPVEDFQELDTCLQTLDEFDWFVLTSVNGVAAVWDRLTALGIKDPPGGLRVACIGPKTAAALAEKGWQADFIPDEYLAEAILPGLGELHGLRVLLARAEIARPALPEAIREGGGIARDISVYRTVPAHPDPREIQILREGSDCLTFTSPSTVENFIQIIKAEELDPSNLPGDPVVACIGPITARAAEKHGYLVRIMPDEYTAEGLLSAIHNYFEENPNEQKQAS